MILLEQYYWDFCPIPCRSVPDEGAEVPWQLLQSVKNYSNLSFWDIYGFGPNEAYWDYRNEFSQICNFAFGNFYLLIGRPKGNKKYNCLGKIAYLTELI